MDNHELARSICQSAGHDEPDGENWDCPTCRKFTKSLDAKDRESRAMVAEAERKTWERAAGYAADYADDGLATPIMRELRSIFIMQAAAAAREEARGKA